MCIKYFVNIILTFLIRRVHFVYVEFLNSLCKYVHIAYYYISDDKHKVMTTVDYIGLNMTIIQQKIIC